MLSDTGARTALAPASGPVLGSDPHDFAGLYIRHRSSFTSHARRYLRDPRDADEVVQEAFLRLFLAMPELETELQALAYCRRTITNLCIDRYRADARRPRLVALEGAPVDELAEDDTGDPVVRAEDAALVREALSKLPELHRAALVMREIEEKPLPVIADELDVAEDSVKHLLFRARRTLRKLLADTSVAPGVDAERPRALRPVVRGASSGAAGLLLLALLGLGSGPDLRAVPVVGVDLPDVLGVTAVADAVRDVVDVVIDSRDDDVAAATLQPQRRPVDRSGTSPGTGDPPPVGAGEPATGSAGSASAGAGAAVARTPGGGAQPVRPGQPVGSPRSTVVTAVDGTPVVSPLLPTGSVSGAAPATSGRPALPDASGGRGPEPVPAGPPLSSGPARDVPASTPARGVVVTVDPPARASGAATSGRSPRVDDAARSTDRAAVDAAEPAEQVTQKAADRAADVAAEAQERAAKAAEQAAERAERNATKAADKAEQAARKAERTASRSAAETEQVAAKAARAAQREPAKAEKAVVKAEKATAKAEKATAKAAEKASRAAEKSAERAAAAEQAVPAGVPTVAVEAAPAPAP